MTRALLLSTLLALALPAAGLAQDAWRLRVPIEGDNEGCYLYTPTVRIADGQGLTQVTLRLDNKRLLVLTDSNIDTEYNDLSVHVDEHAPIAADALLGETNVVFDKSIATIIEQFIAGRAASVNLRFWPTWPTTGLKHAEFSLIGFTKAYRRYTTCR